MSKESPAGSAPDVATMHKMVNASIFGWPDGPDGQREIMRLHQGIDALRDRLSALERELAEARAAHTHCPQCNPCKFYDELMDRSRSLGAALADADIERARRQNAESALQSARADAETLKEAHNALIEDVEEHVEDTKRLDFLERGLMDGSYQSIWNDIIAFCEVGYKAFGRGPALRSAIDVQRDAIAAERKETEG